MRPDLNLLIVFDAVAQTGSVTAAAERLSLSQPAVSHALKRLRDLLGDPLFIRTRKGFLPTPRAETMLGPVRAMLTSAETLLANREFNPATDARRLRLGGSDYAALTLVPSLVRALRKAAPNIKVEIVPVGAATLAHLEEGKLDLSFWGTKSPPPPFRAQTLFREHYVGLMSARHPLARGLKKPNVTLSQYLAYPHISVSMRDPGRNELDLALSRLGRSRNIAVSSHSFAGNMQCLRDGDLIATPPSRLCVGAMIKGLKTFKLPLSVPDYFYSLVWHERNDKDPALIWLRGLLLQQPRRAAGPIVR